MSSLMASAARLYIKKSSVYDRNVSFYYRNGMLDFSKEGLDIKGYLPIEIRAWAVKRWGVYRFTEQIINIVDVDIIRDQLEHMPK